MTMMSVDMRLMNEASGDAKTPELPTNFVPCCHFFFFFVSVPNRTIARLLARVHIKLKPLKRRFEPHFYSTQQQDTMCVTV